MKNKKLKLYQRRSQLLRINFKDNTILESIIDRELKRRTTD